MGGTPTWGYLSLGSNLPGESGICHRYKPCNESTVGISADMRGQVKSREDTSSLSSDQRCKELVKNMKIACNKCHASAGC